MLQSPQLTMMMVLELAVQMSWFVSPWKNVERDPLVPVAKMMLRYLFSVGQPRFAGEQLEDVVELKKFGFVANTD